MKKTLLFLTGPSGSGKGYFKKNILPKNLFYNLISMTTRAIRKDEVDGEDYYFKTENYFEKTNFVTYLDVNKEYRKLGEQKWLYGVSVEEFKNHQNENLVYDVIEPKYIRQMINWCLKNKMDFDFKILYFVKNNNFDISSRKNMENDIEVRIKNTSTKQDFKKNNLEIDWEIISSKERNIYDLDMVYYIQILSQINKTQYIDFPQSVIFKTNTKNNPLF